MVVSAANSAARKRSRPSGSAGRDSRVSERVPDGTTEGGAADQLTSEDASSNGRTAVGGRAAKAREELASVPVQDIPGELAVAELDQDSDEEADADDLDETVDLEDFDLEELGDALGSDLEIADTADVDLP